MRKLKIDVNLMYLGYSDLNGTNEENKLCYGLSILQIREYLLPKLNYSFNSEIENIFTCDLLLYKTTANRLFHLVIFFPLQPESAYLSQKKPMRACAHARTHTSPRAKHVEFLYFYLR